MIRPLLIVFVGGIAVALACGVAYGVLHDEKDRPAAKAGPVETRDFAWSGARTLEVSLPAEVTYIQGSNAKLVATGSRKTLDALRTKDGEFTLEGGCSGWNFTFGSKNTQPSRGNYHERCDALDDAEPLRITITAPATRSFDVSGTAKLDIRNYDQPDLKLQVSGASDAKAAGKTGKLDLEVSGASNADLSEMTLTDATIEVSGAGNAKLKPTGKVEASASGAGGVDLLVRPASLNKDVSGAGHVDQP